MDQNECMLALERLMDEFFNHSTSNERKRSIEMEFQAFKSAPEAWMLCLHCVTHSSSHYVIMFSLSVLESVIHKLDNSFLRVRDEIRQILQNYLFTSGIHAPHYLREKYAKLLVDIAKQDWPHRYPEFIDLINELLNVAENRVLIGLILLRTTSEEFTNDSAVTDKSRREELTRLLEPHIPNFLTTLARILESLDNKPRHTATATPPPSPTHSSIGMEPSGSNFVAPLDPFAPDNKTLNREVLRTLQHLFTWVPISAINSDIIKCIFNIMNISSYSQEDMDLCMLALSTINEILYRKCSPRGTEHVFIQLYHHTVDLLKDLSTSSIYQLESIDYTFVKKLSELIVLLIQQHFWKLEMYSTVSTLDFLSLFFQLTIQLPSAQCYYQCLTTWTAFVKQIKQQNSHKYFEVLQGLLGMMLKKFQYTSNFEQLNSFDNQDVNEDNETEWGLFVKSSNEIIALIAEFAPIDTFNQVLMSWNCHYDSYSTVMTELSKHSSLTNMIKCVEERDRLCCVLTDFSTLTQTLARLSSLFTDDKTEIPNSMDEFIDNLFQKLLECASRANTAQLSNCILDPKVTECLVMVHSELFASLRFWLFWMLQKDKLKKEHLNVLTEITVMMLVKSESTPSSIGYSAACLLHSITDQVSPHQLLEIKPFLDFVNRASCVRHPTMNIRQLIDESVCNVLLSDSTKTKPGGEYLKEFRIYRMYTYMDNLTHEFKTLSPTMEKEKIERVSSHTLESLSHIVEFCRKFSTHSKKTLYLCLKDTMKNCLLLFSACVDYPEVRQNVLTFFVNVFGVLQPQMGLDGTRQALDGFLAVAQSKFDVGHVEKLLQLMKLVVEVPGSAYKTLLPSIVNLCLKNLYQVVLSRSKENPEVHLALLQLLYSLLAHRWQYFHQSQVLAGFSPCVEGEASGGPQKPQELITILEIFGQALLQEDINISKFSIGALEDLDQKWNLYTKDIFREHLLVKFLNALLGALLNKAYCLLSEEVQIAIYHMAIRNNQIFFDVFLPEFVGSLQGVTVPQGQELLRSFQQEKDMPSFINQLKLFVSRAQSFTMCNS